MGTQGYPEQSTEITADWLTRVLRQSGHPEAEVRSLEVKPYRTKPYSTLHLLDVELSGASDLPSRFMLKLARPDVTNATSRRRRRKEFAFYSALAPAMDQPIAPVVHGAGCADDARTAFLLMADLSTTHERPPRGLPPTPDQAERAMRAFGSFHAAWWNHPDLQDMLDHRDDDYVRLRARDAAASAKDFLARFGRYLDPSIVHAVTRFGDHAGLLMATAYAGPVAAIHGDAHPWNVLTPRAGDGPALLLDWEAWTVDSPAIDLASFIVLRFDTRLRRRLEPMLLDTWHDAVATSGIRDYSRHDLLDDYRRAIVRRVSMPLARAARDEEADGWFPILSRIALAWEDLGCDDVLP